MSELVQYVKDKKGQVVGVLVATADPVDPELVGIGFSKCNKVDKYNKQFGLHIARERAKMAPFRQLEAPFSIIEELNAFCERCTRYYKDSELFAPVCYKNGKNICSFSVAHEKV